MFTEVIAENFRQNSAFREVIHIELQQAMIIKYLHVIVNISETQHKNKILKATAEKKRQTVYKRNL